MHPVQRKTPWLFGVALVFLLAACGGTPSGGGGGGGGGGGNTVTVRQTDSGPLVGAFYRVGGGSWQTLSFSNRQATFTATGDYEVAVRCQSGPNVFADVYLFKATPSQASALSFACTSSGGGSSSSPRTFQVSLPTSIGSYTIQTGDRVVVGSKDAAYPGSNPVTLQDVFPDGPQGVLFTVLRGTGGNPPTSVTPIGYKRVDLNLVGGGPFAVDHTGWQPFAATRAIGALNLPSGYQGGTGVHFSYNGMKVATLVGATDRYGTLPFSGYYLGLAVAGGPGGSLFALKETGGNDWTPSLPSPWGAGQFRVNGDTLTFAYPGGPGYSLFSSYSGLLKDSTSASPLKLEIAIYPGGTTTYAIPVVPGLNYVLADFASRNVNFTLTATRGTLDPALLGGTLPGSTLAGLDVAHARREGSFSGASYTLP